MLRNPSCGAQNMAVLRHILTAAPSSPRFICHRQRSATKPGTRVPRSLNHFTQCQNENGHLSVTVFDLAGAEGLGLACRLGRCFCTSCRGLHRRPAPLNTLRVPRSLNHFTQCQNKNGHLSVTVFDLAGAEGLEPSARGFGDRCSTN